ncbi:phospholipase A1-Ibeta2, chloroplastic-like [Elaeis guineensis]|uniref:LOW QUALITY PROTEIN: phospholipase A1-Ibeta2, chloroplastic-like n=1 Tax=Elaeis guineensis var. tenera TaxID=51953 RepID=A0A6I9SCF0_ELAGV|nr:LOW QUALITY PROTEIN: phospholipase A1-Ibeta2, chloroplastic-like [Elaeis guineensis]
MHVGSTIAAPRPISQVRTAFPYHGCRRASIQPLRTTATAAATTTSTQTHLANLERLLQKQSSSPPLFTPNPGKDPDSPDSTSGGGGGGGGGLLSALNLPSLFPSSRKQPEEMSPRTLTRLHRLLYDSPRPSPRGPIASRWRHYHGAADWAGLLDPLDENLRRELVHYGDLVQAAYHAFHSHPEASLDAPRHVALPDRSYRVTRSLFATASVELPRCLDRFAAPWMTQRSSWIGYVAVCDSDHEIRRMGRRDIVIALRGTATCLEWAENFRAGLVPVDDGSDNSTLRSPHAPKVECGFWSLYKTAGDRVPSLSASVVEEVRRLVNQYKGEELSITVTGHSLGAALAVLVADELSSSIPDAPPIAVFSFGGPRVGNRGFADRVEGGGVKVLRVVNAHDMVTRVPLGVAPPEAAERDLGSKWWPARVLERMDGYADVGRELRVDSRASPYLRPDADPACCHDLEAYLHLVDGFMGTDYPFRSNAKRSLARLLSQQGGNVKKLYMSKARELRIGQLDPSPAAAAATATATAAGGGALSRVPSCLASPSS